LRKTARTGTAYRPVYADTLRWPPVLSSSARSSRQPPVRQRQYRLNPFANEKNARPSSRDPLLSCKPAAGAEPTGALWQPALALRLRAKQKIRQTNTLAKPRKTACFSSLFQSHQSFSANLFPVSRFRESICQKTVLVQQTSTAQQMTCTRIKRDANFFSRRSSSSLTRSIASRTG